MPFHSSMAKVHILDYGGGNVQSMANALESLGFQVVFIRHPSDFEEAEVGVDEKL